MLRLATTGAIPRTMAENSGPRDWSASLGLVGDTASLVAVDAIGPGGLYFTASYNAALGIIAVAPGAAVDFEAFVATGSLPQITLQLQFTFADNTRATDANSYAVTILNRDDTPPSMLAFATGGSVEAGAIGATIGTLAVTDVDSAGPFLFTFTDDDSWRFEVVGNTLKLQSGISLGLDDIPHRPIIITVSDGIQSAAFALDLTVTGPVDPAPPGLPTISAGPIAGFTEVSPGKVVAIQPTAALSAVAQNGTALATLETQSGASFALPVTDVVRLPSGMLDFNPVGTAAKLAALNQAVQHAQPAGPDLAQQVAQAAAGASFTDFAVMQLAHAALPVTDADFIGVLFDNSLDRAPTAGEVALLTGRLANGESRAQMVVDIALGAEALAHQAAKSSAYWLALPLGDGSGAGSGGMPAAAATGADQLWLT